MKRELKVSPAMTVGPPSHFENLMKRELKEELCYLGRGQVEAIESHEERIESSSSPLMAAIALMM